MCGYCWTLIWNHILGVHLQSLHLTFIGLSIWKLSALRFLSGRRSVGCTYIYQWYYTFIWMPHKVLRWWARFPLCGSRVLFSVRQPIVHALGFVSITQRVLPRPLERTIFAKTYKTWFKGEMQRLSLGHRSYFSRPDTCCGKSASHCAVKFCNSVAKINSHLKLGH